nr:hypothetical protein [uncultured Arsenicibacter sp.]
MITIEKQAEIKAKVLFGLAKTYESLLVYKKEKKSDLVILRDNKIVRIKM